MKKLLTVLVLALLVVLLSTPALSAGPPIHDSFSYTAQANVAPLCPFNVLYRGTISCERTLCLSQSTLHAVQLALLLMQLIIQVCIHIVQLGDLLLPLISEIPLGHPVLGTTTIRRLIRGHWLPSWLGASWHNDCLASRTCRGRRRPSLW